MSVANAAEPRLDLQDDLPPPWVGQRMSLDAFLKLPHVKPYLEYDDGLVKQKMSAKPIHGSLQPFLASFFNQIAGPRRLGIAYSETRFVTPNWSPVPDVSYYRRSRIPRSGRRQPVDFFEAPDIAVEIVSPDQSVTTLIQKCLRFIALGTTISLLIDPEPEAVLVLRAGQPLVLLQGDDRIDLSDVLPDFELTVRAMFESVSAEWLDDEDGGVQSVSHAAESTPDSDA